MVCSPTRNKPEINQFTPFRFQLHLSLQAQLDLVQLEQARSVMLLVQLVGVLVREVMLLVQLVGVLVREVMLLVQAMAMAMGLALDRLRRQCLIRRVCPSDQQAGSECTAG